MTQTAVSNLTPREQEIATLLAYGLTNSSVGARLGISIRTVEMHRANAMRKIGARSRSDIVRWALDRKLLR